MIVIVKLSHKRRLFLFGRAGDYFFYKKLYHYKKKERSDEQSAVNRPAEKVSV